MVSRCFTLRSTNATFVGRRLRSEVGKKIEWDVFVHAAAAAAAAPNIIARGQHVRDYRLSEECG